MSDDRLPELLAEHDRLDAAERLRVRDEATWAGMTDEQRSDYAYQRGRYGEPSRAGAAMLGQRRAPFPGPHSWLARQRAAQAEVPWAQAMAEQRDVANDAPWCANWLSERASKLARLEGEVRALHGNYAARDRYSELARQYIAERDDLEHVKAMSPTEQVREFRAARERRARGE